MKSQEAMRKPIKCCDSSMSLDQEASEMWNDDLGVAPIPIIDQEQRLLGVVTDRDIAMAATLQHKPLIAGLCRTYYVARRPVTFI